MNELLSQMLSHADPSQVEAFKEALGKDVKVG